MDTEVVIIGAGLAGTTLAGVCARNNISVLVVDNQKVYPDAFRAEKIEYDQAEQMRKLGIFEYRVPDAGPIGKTINYRMGKRTEFDTVEQYGLKYGDFVNRLRHEFLDNQSLIIGNVTSLDSSYSMQNVYLSDGNKISCKVVVLATGGLSSIASNLRYEKRSNPSLRTYNVGLYIEPENIDSFDFSGFNYFLSPVRDGIDYLTLFKIDDRMRINLFTQLKRNDKNAVNLRKDTLARIKHYFPDLEEQIGKIKAASKTQVFFTDFYRQRNVGESGVVMIADEYQSVCPATGTGLSKVFTDVDVLGNEYLPGWLNTGVPTSHDIIEYYNDKRKAACDKLSLYQWIYYRNGTYNFWQKQWSKLDTRLRNWFGLW